MKQRFSSLDVNIIVQELSRTLCSLRLSNVYDLCSRVFLFKFAKPDERHSLLVDSGFRCHLTEFTRATAAAPSPFVARLRKFLRSRRVTSVSQVGTDRVIEVQFSDGQYRLFLEFYAGGNIILTDRDLSILSLLRMVSEGPDQEELHVGVAYHIERRQNYHGVPPVTEERVRAGLQQALTRTSEQTMKPNKRSRNGPGGTLRKALANTLHEYPPILLDHTLRITNFDASISLETLLADQMLFAALMASLQTAKQVAHDIKDSTIVKGFIIAKALQEALREIPGHSEESQTPHAKSSLHYEDFQPFRPRHLEDDPSITILEIQGYNKTVDTFFSSLESQKLESRLTEREAHAMKKLESAKLEHQKRLGGLQEAQELNVRKAQAIEINLRRVEEACAAVNALVAKSIGWPEVAHLVAMEQQRYNEVAMMIKLPLKLHENTITLLLAEVDGQPEVDYEGDETDSEVSSGEADGQPPLRKDLERRLDERLAVDIDLALSPWSNARQYYDQKKTASAKEQRTLLSSEKVLKNTEKKITADLKRGLKQEKDVMRPQRQALWFEKFFYFFSSDGYLVIGGKDAQQSDILYTRHLRKGDIYVHADLHGAVAMIIKNKPGMSHDPIPPSTLSQAGTFTICTSSAWDSKAIMSAWWARAEQVSKLDPTGDYLQSGILSVEGDKNFLPPAQLLLGFGVMFQISKGSQERHLKHRVHEETTRVPEKNKAIQDLYLDKEVNSMNSLTMGRNYGDHEDATNDVLKTDHNDQTSIGDKNDSGDTRNLITDGSSHRNGLHPDPAEPSIADELQPEVTLSSPKMGDVYSPGSEIAPASGGEDEYADKNPHHEARPLNGVCRLSSEDQLRQACQNPGSEEDLRKQSDLTATTAHDLSKASQPNVPIPKNRVRGQQGKQMKVKTKYGDQDEEDRALAMRLLGSTNAQQKVKEDSDVKSIKEQGITAAKERRRKQQLLDTTKSRAAEALHRRILEESTDQMDEGDVEHMDILELLIGTPLPGDEVVDALVVCGPWDAIGSRCRWKAKLQPGSTKKGKTIKEIIGSWNAAISDQEKRKRSVDELNDEIRIAEDNTRRREMELIRAFREIELVGTVPVGKMRVVLGANEDTKNKGHTHGKARRGGRGNKKR